MTKMLNAKVYKRMKYEIIEAYYNLYHKNNFGYPEARDKESYCELMLRQVGINELENMKKMSMRTVVETENKMVEKDAMKLYRLICGLKERFYYFHEEPKERSA